MTIHHFNTHAFYARLDAARAERGTSWAAICGDTGVHKSDISRIERMGKPPSVTALARLLKWLGDTDIGPYICTERDPSTWD